MKIDKYLIFHLVRHSSLFYAQTPEEENTSQEAINEFFLSWSPRVRQIIGAHAMNMAGDWDWMGVFTANELSDWEAFREEYRRRFPGRTEKSLSLLGVSHEEFTRATENIPHYQALRALGSYPGAVEKEYSREE
jgi:hypothetical protein